MAHPHTHITLQSNFSNLTSSHQHWCELTVLPGDTAPHGFTPSHWHCHTMTQLHKGISYHYTSLHQALLYAGIDLYKHCFTVTLRCKGTNSHGHCITLALLNTANASLWHCSTIVLLYIDTDSLSKWHCFTVTLHHVWTVSLEHCFSNVESHWCCFIQALLTVILNHTGTASHMHWIILGLIKMALHYSDTVARLNCLTGALLSVMAFTWCCFMHCLRCRWITQALLHACIGSH